MDSIFLAHELVHVLLAIFAILFFSIKYKNFWSVFLGILGSVFVDADHLFDYFKFYGLKFNLQQMISSSYFTDSGKVFVFFHGWEYVVIFLFLGKISRKTFVFYPLAITLFFHLAWDQISYTSNPLAYSILFRFLHGFDIHFFNGV